MHNHTSYPRMLLKGLLLMLILFSWRSEITAGGIQQLLPDGSTDTIAPVMLFANSDLFGNFASPNADPQSRLYFTIAAGDENINIRVSELYDQLGRSRGVNGGAYTLRVRNAAGTAIFLNTPSGTATSFRVTQTSANATTFSAARYSAGGDNIRNANALAPGEYYIEFSNADNNISVDGDRIHVAYWDFTVSAANDDAIPGRVWSRNWAFRTPPNDINNLSDELCLWNRNFNGALYSHTGNGASPGTVSEGFVTEVDFNGAEFKGLAFNIAFNSRGPGIAGTSLEDARQSVPDNLATAQARDAIPEYRIFLEIPDTTVFPIVPGCAEVTFLEEDVRCDGEEAICFPVNVGGPGQTELIIDFDDNLLYDAGTADVILLFDFDAAAADTCLAWNQTDGLGNFVPPGTAFNLIVRFGQGIQHFAAFDVEQIADGFCVNTVLPGPDELTCLSDVEQDLLYYDDQLINSLPFDNAPADVLNGIDGTPCGPGGTRRWDNFVITGSDCDLASNGNGVVEPGTQSGFGEDNLLNTWWYAQVDTFVRRIVLMDVTIVGPNPVCVGSETDLAATIAGGTSPFEFEWTGPAGTVISTDSILTVSTPGEYIVAITDATGCMASDTIDVSFEGEITCEVDGPETICLGQTATYAAVPDSDSPPFTFTWTGPDGSTISNDSTITITEAGEYCVMITDAGGCETECCKTLTVLNEDFSCSVDGPALICAGDTAVYTAVPSGGDAPFVFAWRFGTDPAVIATDASLEVSTAGEYCATITDANGCETECCQTLGFFPDFSCEIESPGTENGTDVTICEGDSTTFTVVFTNGAPPITLEWELNGVPISGPETLTVSQPGTYTITATDGNGCVTTCERTLIVISRPTVVVTSSEGGDGPDTICVGDGIVYTADTGDDTGPFTYEWTNAASVVVGTERELTVSIPGEYCVVVTNAEGCPSAPACRTLANFPELSCEIDPEEDAVCTGETTTFTVTITGGEGPFDFQWTGPNGDIDGDLTVTVGEAGLYIVTVTDANGCVTTCNAILTVLDVPTVVVDGPGGPAGGPGPDTICVGDNIVYTANTGDDTGPFTYVWTNEAGDTIATTETITVDEAGEYCVVVTNAADCASEPGCRTLEFFPELSCEITGDRTTICEGDEATFTVTVTGGEAPFDYDWSGPGGPFDNAPEIIVSEDGTYSVVVTDANGCTTNCSLDLTVIPTPVVVIQGDAEICDGSTTDWTAEVTSDNDGPFTYAWTGPDGFTSTAQTITIGTEGEYCVTVTDANGCVSEETCRTLTVSDEITCNVTGPTSICEGDEATFGVTLEGGGDIATYAWTGPDGFEASSETITVTTGGEYCVTVEDDNGCETECCIDLMVAPLFELEVIGADVICDGDTTIYSFVTEGGTAPFTVAWTGPGGFTSTDESIEVSVPGEYCANVTDSLGCMVEACRTLNPSPDFSCEVQGESAICAGETTPYTAVVTGGVGPFEYEWSGPGDFSATGETVTVSESGTYSVEITDANGCTTNCTLDLNVIDITVIGDADPAEIIIGESTTLTATAGGCTNCVFMWFGPDGELLNETGPTITVMPDEAGVFTYTVVVGEGEDMLCPTETTITVTVRSDCDPDAVKLANAFTPNGDNLNDVLFVQAREPRDPELSIELIIYNRWGEEVFTTESFDLGWDGTHRGDPLPPDVYGYWMRVTCPDGFETTEKGNVSILR